MACTYDLTTNLGKVRLLINDTDVVDCHFSDDEIDVFLVMASTSVLVAAAIALEAWAASLAENLESEKIGDYSYTKKQAANKLALASRYRATDESTPYMTWASMDLTGEDDSE